MAALSVIGAQWRLKASERAFLLTELMPWALQAGTRCADLMCLDYESRFKVALSSLPFHHLAIMPHGLPSWHKMYLKIVGVADGVFHTGRP